MEVSPKTLPNWIIGKASLTALDDDQGGPKETALEKAGLVDIVYPNRRYNHTENGVRTFDDKLREFIHYQPLSSHKAPDVHGAIKVCSPEGKKMFKEALETPFMEAYFTVSPQIDNQPVLFCGRMSLVVALNSLDIDPARGTWSEHWRWNHLGSLACCTTVLQNPNTALQQLAYLAVCNDTRAFPKIVTDYWTLDDFRSWVKMAVSRSDMVMIVNHGRGEMNQIGGGHYLPMTGYHEGKDMILFYDIAKHKYVPLWCPLQTLFTATQSKDPTLSTGLNRGFCLLMRPDYETSKRIFGPSTVFRIDDIPGNTDPQLEMFLEGWNRLLDENVPEYFSHEEIITEVIHRLLTVTQYNSSDKNKHHISLLEMTLKYFRNQSSLNDDCSTHSSVVARCRRAQCPTECPNTLFRQQIESLNIFQSVCKVMKSLDEEKRKQILDLVVAQMGSIDDAVKFSKGTCQYPLPMQRTANFFRDLYGNQRDSMTGKQNGISNENRWLIGCPGFIELFPEHIATFILLSWPYYMCERRNMLKHDAFIEILKEYRLPHLNCQEEDDYGKPDVKQCSLKENYPCDFQGYETNKKTSFREHMNQLVCADLNRSNDYRILNEQVGSIRGKFMVVLDYHKH